MKSQPKSKLSAAFVTDTGYSRDHNEDSGIVNLTHAFFAVADGLGGHQAGEVASAVCCKALNEKLSEGDALDGAIQYGHSQVYEVACGNNMGTTLVALQIGDGHYDVGWVGDSRAYLLRKHLTQLTKDHSLVQEMLDSGELDEGLAAASPVKNVLSQAIGLDNDIEPETVYGSIEAGDVFLLCSDGLTNEVSDQQIATWLNKRIDVELIAQGLVNDALSAGGRDNVTVVVVRIDNVVEEPTKEKMANSLAEEKQNSEARTKKANIVLPLAIGSGLAVIFVMVLLWFLKG